MSNENKFATGCKGEDGADKAVAIESTWDIIEGGCSWYCGGGNYKTTSTKDSLNPTSHFANDLSYKTAWIEEFKKGTQITKHV